MRATLRRRAALQDLAHQRRDRGAVAFLLGLVEPCLEKSGGRIEKRV